MPLVVGANLPWIDYGADVGTSAWHPSGGLAARPAARERLRHAFASLAADGVGLVRTFVLCDLRSGVRFRRDGLPIGLDDEVFADLEALLAEAVAHGIGLIPVLLDFHLCHAAQTVGGVQTGGRGYLMVEEEGRGATIEHVLLPIVRRYDGHEAIVAWDLFNEPDWCVGLLSAPGGLDPFAVVQAFLATAVDAVRASTAQPVTIGLGAASQLDLVRPLGLDVYQVHWYEPHGWAALQTDVADFGLDAPVILGEFPGRSDRVGDILDTAERAGYAGALVWSRLARDEASGYPPEMAAWLRSRVTDSSTAWRPRRRPQDTAR
jgi:sugar phosphate isomerase/epimerase